MDTRAFSARLPLLLYLSPTSRTHEETSPERIIAETHAKLQAGTPVKDMLLASALAEAIGHCDQFAEILALLARTLARSLSLEGAGEGLSVRGLCCCYAPRPAIRWTCT
jgi:hypothetical protein